MEIWAEGEVSQVVLWNELHMYSVLAACDFRLAIPVSKYSAVMMLHLEHGRVGRGWSHTTQTLLPFFCDLVDFAW